MAPSGDFDWELHVGRLDQLDEVERIGRAAIGAAHPDAEEIARRLAVNPEVLRVLGRRHRGGDLELCGYSLLYPLTDPVGEAVAAARIRSGTELGADSLLPRFTDARFLYVGMLLGTDTEARTRVKADLRSELARRIGNGRVASVFARPATASGLRLLRARGFVAIADERNIWSLRPSRSDRAFGADPP